MTLLSAAVLLSLVVPGTTICPKSEPIAEMGDVVSLGLRVSYLNGQIFDSTFNQPPFAIRLGSRHRIGGYVRLPIIGLDKGILGMKPGEKKKFDISPQEGFGAIEIGDLPKNSPLTVEVELYEVLKKLETPKLSFTDTLVGTGDEIAEGKTVVAHYRGTFLNGVEFDSSRKISPETGNMMETPLQFIYGKGNLVAGFQPGMKGMKAGGKRTLRLPFNLAYGENGSSGMPPLTTLVFEIELVSVKG